MAPPLCLVLVTALFVSLAAADEVDWTWKSGRATVFGDDGRGSYCTPEQYDHTCWSINEGNCGFGFIWPDEPLGLDVAALSDQASDFPGSCGRCYEIKCNPSTVKDGYGASFDRTAACYDKDASVVVRIVDSCPCNYPANPYSNKRWCCGDAYHFDVSVWAFEKLADVKQGVIPLQYRAVPCDYQPAKPAPPIAHPTPGQPAPANAVKPQNVSAALPNKKWSTQQSDSVYQGPSSTNVAISPPTSYVQATASAPSFAPPASASPGTVFDRVLQNGWVDASWGAVLNWAAGNIGPQGENVVCATVDADGALAVSHAQGIFQGMKSLEFWVKVDQGMPDVAVNIGSAQSGCSPIKLAALAKYDWRSGWAKYQAPLSQFSSTNTPFNGCGGMGTWDLTHMEFKSQGHPQNICLSSIQLFP